LGSSNNAAYEIDPMIGPDAFPNEPAVMISPFIVPLNFLSTEALITIPKVVKPPVQDTL
jgi:hypothetical protein